LSILGIFKKKNTGNWNTGSTGTDWNFNQSIEDSATKYKDLGFMFFSGMTCHRSKVEQDTKKDIMHKIMIRMSRTSKF